MNLVYGTPLLWNVKVSSVWEDVFWLSLWRMHWIQAFVFAKSIAFESKYAKLLYSGWGSIIRSVVLVTMPTIISNNK